ncbi:nitrilase-related carbon-nitrogen hydrolase [Sulfurospirillum arcachonense]|uniref:nitrilase-related carbon-nitrogen hydrolase n=1 Tax=Sulfurospirillum arcachonense TaxID=57666 RepID=UPI00046AD008|nr:nitrilase-related carbon-nitrogen hydrolase [Sulfurospirillum arcachonense]
MNITLVQNTPKLKKMSFDKFQEELQKIDGDLIVFPELALNGYLLKDAVFEDAYSLEEIEKFATLSTKQDIVFGCVLKCDHKIYNSAVYCSGGKVLHVHHKNILPNYGLFQEARFFFEGEELKSFETNYGEVMVVICEEMFSAKVIEQIAATKPQLVIVLSNSPARGFEDDKLLIEHQWNSLLSTSAILSGANVVFVNRVGFEDGLGFWGGSRHINPKGEIIKKAKLFENELLHVEIDKHISKTQKYLLRIK